MILILSDPVFQSSVDEVIDHLRYRKAPFLRVNGLHLDELEKWDLRLGAHGRIPVGERSIHPKEVGAVWAFRWFMPMSLGYPEIALEEEGERETMSQLMSEKERLSEYFFSLFDHAYWLTRLEQGSINKLMVLDKARDLGLRTPESLVTTSRKEVERFMKECDQGVISKSLYEIFQLHHDQKVHSNYTCEIPTGDLEEIPERFQPSLFQEKVPKRFDIRSFYLEGGFWSMAILSQEDERTRLDFRIYDYEKPNRNVPFKLPNDIEKKLEQLMSALDLRTGSIDLLLDEKGNFHFLEVNPIGQFGMTSKPCDHQLEKAVAQTLIHHDQERRTDPQQLPA